jgi:hypothetical protein
LSRVELINNDAWHIEKSAKNGRKVKAIALLFCCFLPLYEKWKMENEKSAKNGGNVKAIALLFCCFLPIYEQWKKPLKMDKK